MDELHTAVGIETFGEFKGLWHELAEEDWQLESTLSTEDEGQVLVFKRTTTGLGNSGLL